MAGIRPGIRRLFRLTLRRPADAVADARAELEALLDEHVAHLVARGVPPDAARADAIRHVGAALPEAYARVEHSALHKERRMRLHERLQDAVADLRLAVRALRRAPAMAGAVILTLALAIGANTAIFSAVSAVLLKPLPFAEPDRLVMLWEENPDFGWVQQDAAPANMLDWKRQTSVFTDVAGYPSFGSAATLTGHGDPRILKSQQATGNLFDVLGVPAMLGRTFTEAETWSTGGPRIGILSYPAWRDVFGADSGIVGKSIELDGRTVEVIGVLPERFQIPGLQAYVWRPMGWDPASTSQVFFRRAHWLKVVGRLRPGVALEQADADLQRVVRQLQQDYPATNTRMGAGMTPLHEFLVGKTRLPLLVTFGGVATLFLIGCANVANLLLVRAAGRTRELAVRLALGAGRARLLRQSLAEGAVLVLAGGALGLLLGWWGTRLLAALQPTGMLPVSRLPMDWSTLAFVLAVVTVAALVFGAVPVLWSRRMAAADALREDGRGASAGPIARRWGNVLLVTQVALALTLTTGAALCVRSYVLLQNVEPGFDSRNVLTASLFAPAVRYDSAAKVVDFYDRIIAELRAQPDVQAAAAVSKVPLGPPSWSSQFAIEGEPPRDAGAQVIHREITPGYLDVMRVPLLQGRMFTDADRAGAPAVVVVNQAFVRRYAKDVEIVGKRIAFDATPDSTSVWRTVVGVVGDERQNTLSLEPEAEIYAPFAQDLRRGMFVVVRTSGPAERFATALRATVRRLDPAIAISELRTMDAVRAAAVSRERFLAVLLMGFAVVGLTLGLIGIYGVVAQVAQRRTREVGIRLALGAGAREVQWLLVRSGVGLSVVGIAAGTLVALVAGRALRSLLYQTSPSDPVILVAVPVLVLLTAMLASWIPALRAARTDPSQVLRSD